MKRSVIFPAFLLLTLASCTQKAATDQKESKTTIPQSEIKDIRITNLNPAIDENKFPVIHIANNKDLEVKINTFLQVEHLKHIPGIFKKNPFEKVIYGHDNNAGGSVSFDDWSQHKTIPDILSLTMNEEGTGAYTEAFQTHCNFDLRSGNPITLKHIFTTEGLAIVAKQANKDVRKQIEDYLKTINDPDAIEEMDPEDSLQLEEERSMYTSCLENVDDYEAEYYSFYFSGDSLLLIRNRCSNHANMALDELGDYTIRFSFRDITRYLSPYGTSLLNNDNKNINTPTPGGKMYKGFINDKYPITALLNHIGQDSSLTLNYWYDKTKIPIICSGKFVNGHFSFTEDDGNEENPKEVAKIEANWVKDSKIAGTWTNSKTKQVLRFDLNMY